MSNSDKMCNTLIADIVVNSYEFSYRRNEAVGILHYLNTNLDGEPPSVVLKAKKTIYFPDLEFLVKEGECFRWMT